MPLELPLAPMPKSRASARYTLRPRFARSRAVPRPLIPPPTIATSNRGGTPPLDSSRFHRPNMKLRELLFRHLIRRIRHQIDALLRLRIRHDITQRIGAREQHI